MSKIDRLNAIRVLVLTAAALGSLVIIPTLIPHGALGHHGRAALGVTGASIILWASGVFDPAAVGLIVILLLIVMLRGMEYAVILSGFSSPVLYFMLSVLVLGSAVVASGLASRLSRIAVRASKGSSLRLLVQVTAFLPVMAVFVPSALARNAILLPVYKRTLDYKAFRSSPGIGRAVALILARLNPMASSLVMTGGIAPAMAASMLGGFTWARWSALMALPYLVAIALGFLLILAVASQRRCTPGIAVVDGMGKDEGPCADLDLGYGKMTSREWWVLGALGIACALWFTDSIHGYPPAVPGLVAAALVLLPWPAGLGWKVVSPSLQWSLIIVSGAALCLSNVLHATGGAHYLVTLIYPRNCGGPMGLALVMALSALAHAAIPSLPAAIAVLLPIVAEISRVTGMNPIALGLASLMAVDAVALYPAQSSTVLMVYEGSSLSRRDILVFGLGMLAIVILVGLLIAVPWWAMLGMNMYSP